MIIIIFLLSKFVTRYQEECNGVLVNRMTICINCF